jgi:hypothetical protein
MIARRKETKMRDDPNDIPMVYLVYVVLGILMLTAGAVTFIVRTLQHF